jgi:transcriptional regulator with XRE-family HTH domain
MEDRVGADARAGIALSSIQGFLSGEVVPSLPFLQEAAAVLGVRPAWLAFGEGLPTDDEMEALRAMRWDLGPDPAPLLTEAATAIEGWQERVRDRLAEGAIGFLRLPPASRASILRAHERYARLRFPTDTPAESFDESTARLGDYLSAPFRILGLDQRGLTASERALIVEALLRPLDIVAWNASHEEKADGR